MSDIIVGLDIGTTKIVVIVARKNEYGKIEPLGVGKSDSLGVSRGVVVNIDRTIESISEAIKQAEENAKVDIGEVFVGIAGQHIKSMQHRGQRIRHNINDQVGQKDIDILIEDMYKLAIPPGDEIIHVFPQKYIIDDLSDIKDPIGHAGVKIEGDFHIVTGNVAAVRNINKCISQSGVETIGLTLEPIASALAVLSEEEKEAGVVLVDIGGGTTDVAIFHEGIIRHTAVIPFGGNIITQDIKEGCGIMDRQAELLKKKFGSALVSESKANEIVAIPGLRGRDPKEISCKKLAGIIQGRMEEILDFIYCEIKNSGFEKKLIAGVVLTGGGSQLKHLSQLTEYVTGMYARIGYPTEHLSKTNITALTNPIYATSVGLLIDGIGKMNGTKNKEKKKEEEVKGHSKKVKGGFFDKILDSTKEFFEDEQ